MCKNCVGQETTHYAEGGVAVSGYNVAFSANHQSNVLALIGGAKWDDAVITYSFPNSTSDYLGAGETVGDYGSGELSSGFAQLTSTQQEAVRDAFEMYAELLGVTFQEVTGSSDGTAIIRFGQSAVPSTAWAYLPAGADIGGDVWLGSGAGYYSNPSKGTYGYHTVLHEIGHALGLKHGHETSGHGALAAEKNGMAYSMMTYYSHQASSGSGYTNEYWGYAQSAMQYDVAALQALYGVNTSHNLGDTTYSWSSTTGAMLVNGVAQEAAGSNRIFSTLWDAGGRDRIDLTNYSEDAVLDLNEGGVLSFSSLQKAQLQAGIYAEGNVYLSLDPDQAHSGLIEEIKAGSGDDLITGNVLRNRLIGKAGDDEIRGAQGHDVIKGSGGHDRLFGNTGNDRLDGGLGRDILVGGGGADRFILKTNSNVDRIKDFTLGVDLIEVGNIGLASLSSNDSGHLVVDYGSDGARFVLQGLSLGDATLGDLLVLA